MKYPKVYIVILNYNNWTDTIECLESVLRNDYPNYQVIVVDNKSPNNSMEYLKAWAEGKLDVWVNPAITLRGLTFPPLPKPIPYVFYFKEEAEKGGNLELENRLVNSIPPEITSKYPIVFIQSRHNLGFAGGNNIAIKYVLSKGDFDSIILLNNDTVVRKNSISELMNIKKKYGDKAIYSGRIFYYHDPQKIWYDGGHFNEWIGRTKHLNMGKYLHEIKNEPKVKEVNFITFCFVLIPKFILQKVGLLDESYFMYVEDLDYSYSYRVWKSGYKLYHVKSSEIWHKVGASSGEEEISEFSAYWMMRNRVKFIISKLALSKKLISLLLLTASRPIKFVQYYIRGNKFIISAQIKGFIDGFSK